jgi:hypothetical protein
VSPPEPQVLGSFCTAGAVTVVKTCEKHLTLR